MDIEQIESIEGPDFSNEDRHGAVFRDQYLEGAKFYHTNLTDADFRGADLTDAFFKRAILTNADFRGADVDNADFCDAILTNADFRDTDLMSDCDFKNALMTGIKVSSHVPVVPHIDAAILAAVGDDESRLNMDQWHICGTTHCRAGWAITLAGDAGGELERIVGPYLAGVLIYAASRPDQRIPDFFDNNTNAMNSLWRGALLDPSPAMREKLPRPRSTQG